MKTKRIKWIYSLWILLIVLSYSWNYYIAESNNQKVVENKARSFFSQIVVARSWNSKHGGVYVPVTKETQPNLYLMDSLRDVTTIGGLKLTKINPAFMTRQISEINKVENDLQFHITSLNPIRPDNKADAWENKALKSFRNGKHELLELVDDDSVAQYRYMAALVTEKSCLKCHAVQGYNEGDIRGGISISFPSRIYKQSENARLFHLLIAHFLILIVGLFGIYSYFKMEQHLFTIIHEKNQELESDTKLLRQTNEELLKINTEKNKFFSIIAHDLRSPFTSFLGFTQIMVEKSQTMSKEEVQNYAVSMSNSANNLYLLLENLLEWACIQQGLIPFSPEQAKLYPIVDSSIAMVVDIAAKKEIEIKTSIPYSLEVVADNMMLQTIIRNLVSNAVKFTPKKGNIYISAKVLPDQSIEISVQDTGIGMNKKMIDTIFRMDVNTNRAGTDGEASTGLGLIICKDFIEKHGGKLWVESEEGKGSTFKFTLAAKN
ncbi:MAG: ATP-binding protein [Bacteroidales bacterium]